MWKFFDQIYTYLLQKFTEIELIDAGSATHRTTDEGLLEGGQGVFQIMLDADELSFRDIENFGHNELYQYIERNLMPKHRYVESFEVTTRKDMIIVSIYYKNKRKASSIPSVTRVLLLNGWFDGKAFRTLPDALRELGGDLLMASRAIPHLKSIRPDKGEGAIRLETLEGAMPAEKISLMWYKDEKGLIVLSAEEA